MTIPPESRAFPTPIALPSIRGLMFRHVVAPGDYAGMNDTATASRLADGEDFIIELDGFANFYDHLSNCDRDRDVLIAEVEGTIVGYGRTFWYVEGDEHDGLRVHEVLCFLRPDWRRS